MKQTRLGDILLRQGKITREQLDNVLREVKLQGDTLTAQLVKQNLFTEEELASFIAKSFGRPLVNLDEIEIEPDIAKLSLDVMRKNMVLPIRRKGNVLTLAVADPYDINSLDEVAFISGCQVDVAIVQESQLLKKLDEIAGSDEQLEDVMADLGASDMEVVDTSEAELDEHTLTAETEAAPVVKLVNLVLLDAIKRGASDIHIEP
ncbi:MAG: type II secretion system protein GspE, partial [Mariprofundaceae bacterium]|nr:type II secretion system protein GspE [Mariprofundaceae bacterium]